MTHSIIHLKTTSNWRDRILETKKIISKLKPSSVLDIGGVDYQSFCKSLNINYTSINLEIKQNTGTGGYHSSPQTIKYDGRNLPFSENSYDLVIINFVLHHAANNTLYLLEQIKRISKEYIIIGEDLASLDYDIEWHQRNYKHQPGGIFRSDEEWLRLFKLYNLTVISQYIIHRSDDIRSEHIYRCLYIIKVS